MASTPARSVSDSGAGGAGFSYAQAAKGRTASVTPAAGQPSQTTSGSNTPSKESHNSMEGLNGVVQGTNSTTTEHVSTTADGALSKTESHPADAVTKSSLADIPKSSPTSPRIKPESATHKDIEGSWRSVPKADTGDRAGSTQREAAADKASDLPDKRRGKKGRREKGTEKESEPVKEEVKPEVFVAAPPPAVNIWQKRAEAQRAEISKTKATAAPIEGVQQSLEDASASASIAAKAADVRKKSKSVYDETDRPVNAASSPKDQQSSKGSRKGFETNGRLKDDSTTRRSAPRGSRVSEKDDKPASKPLPPPVEDATSWPTPDKALEEKRESSEKTEKQDPEEGNATKSRPKKEWVTVPFIPTINWQTYIPPRPRGGRGGGGRPGAGSGRGGHTANGSISEEKSTNSAAPAGSSGGSFRERGRDNASVGRATSLPPNASKRASEDASYSPPSNRKPSISTGEQAQSEDSTGPSGVDAQTGGDNHSSSITDPADSAATTVSQQAGIDNGKPKSELSSRTALEGQSQSRFDRRSEPNIRDFSKETNGHGQPRERGEGRGERGRGGYRGRGGHASFPNGQAHGQNAFMNGHAVQAQNPFARQATAPYSPPQQQNQYGASYNVGGRAGRGGPPRAQSIPTTNSMYNRLPHGAAPLQPIAPLQAASPVFDYPVQPMSAVPYAPSWEPYSVLAMVTMQLEYYFSIDNLCKDVFLRKHMDSKGFVFLTTIASFKRIQHLTQEFEVLRFACQESEVIEIVVGDDGIDRLRRKDGWEQWVLAMEERDEVARNDGPERFYRQQSQRFQPQPFAPRMMGMPPSTMSPPAFSPNGTQQAYGAFANPTPPTNGVEHPVMYPNESPLSAAVPDFAPSAQPTESEVLAGETTFTDEEVEKLQLVYNRKEESGSTGNEQRNSRRTFSNGSIDGRTIGEELHESQSREASPLTNGTSLPIAISPSSSKSSSVMSPTKLAFSNPPPVMWAKGQNDQAPVAETNQNESYSVVRDRALRHRESSAPGEIDGDMKLLYQFWSHFLVRNFNPRMYEDFRTCAAEDVQLRQDMFGMNNLINYYDEILNSKKKPISEILAKHYVDLVNSEDRTQARPGFKKLRAAWRNGALDLRSRKTIDGFVDMQLRQELDL